MERELALVTESLLVASGRVPNSYYHRWRCLWLGDMPFHLCGEIDKSGNPIIRRGPKPEFLVHWPGQMANLLIVEVEPANARRSKMLKDLRTLTYFRRGLDDANYHAAYFWIYGVSLPDWQHLGAQLTASAAADQAIDSWRC